MLLPRWLTGLLSLGPGRTTPRASQHSERVVLLELGVDIIELIMQAYFVRLEVRTSPRCNMAAVDSGREAEARRYARVMLSFWVGVQRSLSLPLGSASAYSLLVVDLHRLRQRKWDPRSTGCSRGDAAPD